MPRDFEICRRNGGKVRRIARPNAQWGLKEGEYMNVCTRAGEWFRGEVRKAKGEKDGSD